MPSYIVSELDAVVLALSPGVNFYSLGSFNDRVPPTKMQVTSVAITSNVATYNVTILEGYIPVVGALATVRGTQTLGGTAGSGFNVSNVALASVSINSTTGIGTVTLALSHANVATTTDAGFMMVPQPEIGDAAASGTTGEQCALQAMMGLANNSRDVSWSTETPSAPVSYTAALQGAEFDQDGLYVNLDTMTAPGTQIVNGVRVNFLRIKLTALSGGTNPTIVGKILV